MWRIWCSPVSWELASFSGGYNNTHLSYVMLSFTHGITIQYTANEGPVRIQYKCLVPIYVFPEMNLLFPKQNDNVLSSSSYTHISVSDWYISKIGPPNLLQGNMWTDPDQFSYFLFIVSVSVRYILITFTPYEYNHPSSFGVTSLFFFIARLLNVQWENLFWGAEPSLPYSRPAHYQQSCAIPSSALHPELRCTLRYSISSLWVPSRRDSAILANRGVGLKR